MNWTGKSGAYFLLILLPIVLVAFPVAGLCQVQIKGTVFYEKDESPAAFATIELQNQKEGSLSDKSGNFSLQVPRIRNNDTLLISSVGYETLKIPVSSAIKKSRFVLVEKTRDMQSITVKSFTSREEFGSKAESVGYFRSWSYNHTGGEIGRVFNVPYKEFKIDKIRFKVSNLCDTCLLRLRIRNMVDGQPGDEIMKDSVTMTINKLTLDDKVPEFDISAYDFTFTQREFFVSIEVLNCRSKNAESCSFCFAGTEKGKYIYKSRSTSDWVTIDDYTVHLKLFLRY